MVAVFITHTYRFHHEQLEVARNMRDWSNGNVLCAEAVYIATSGARLVAAGVLAHLHLPAEWSARLIVSALAGYPQFICGDRP
jgi:hypothetical protein